MIKDLEGFRKTPIWDGGQYSVGYGCSSFSAEKYGFDPTDMTSAEAHQLILFVLDEMEDSVDNFLQKNNLVVSQQQYDAMMSFTYNLGKGSINSTSRIGKLLLQGSYTTNQMASAFGIYCHTGTGKNAVVQDHLVSRRVREAKLFLFGAYDFFDVDEKFCRLTYLGNVPSGYSDVALYQQGSPYQILFEPDPTSEYAAYGQYFVGWYNADTLEPVTPDTIVTDNITVFPMWSDEYQETELVLDAEPHVFRNWINLTEKTYVNGRLKGENDSDTELPELEKPEVNYYIVNAKLLDAEDNALNTIPQNGFYFSAKIFKTSGEKSATTMLVSYTKEGKMLDTYFVRTNIQEQTSFDVGVWIENRDKNVGQLKVFVISSLSNPEPLCASLTIS